MVAFDNKRNLTEGGEGAPACSNASDQEQWLQAAWKELLKVLRGGAQWKEAAANRTILQIPNKPLFLFILQIKRWRECSKRR